MKITRRQLNSLIREHLGLEQGDTLNELFALPALPVIAKWLGITAATSAPFYMDEIIAGFKNMASYNPVKRALVLLDPEHPENPVNLMEPVIKRRTDRGGKKITYGITLQQQNVIVKALKQATDPVDTDEPGIEKALKMCKTKYEIAQVAHQFKEMGYGNLKDEIYTDLTEDEFSMYVTMVIDSIVPAVTLKVAGDPDVYSYTDDEWAKLLQTSYKTLGKKLPSEEGEGEEKEKVDPKTKTQPGPKIY